MYAEWSFYQLSYRCGADTLIPEKEYGFWAAEAERRLDSLTMGRLNKENVTDRVRLAVCEMAERLYQTAARRGIASENNDGYSVVYSTSKNEEKELVSIAIRYLGGDGLLYRGG